MLGKLMSQMAVAQEKAVKYEDAIFAGTASSDDESRHAFYVGMNAGLESALRLIFGTILDLDDILRQANIEPIGKQIINESLDPDAQ